MMSLRRWGRLAVWVLLSAPTVLSAQGLYMHVIPVSDSHELPDQEAENWPLEMTVNRLQHALDQLPPVLAAQPLGEAAEDGSGRLRIDLKPGLVIAGELRPEDRRSSFVIDFHEPSVVSLAEELMGSWSAQELAEQPSVSALVRFTGASIGDKSMTRGWSLASRVAREGIGDCTEHAVLLTALARFFGYPARVVIGLAVVVTPEDEAAERRGELGVFGHAWAEIYDDGQWNSADATAIDETAEGKNVVRLLPLLTLEDEGPGYSMDLARFFNFMPRRVAVGQPVGEH